MQLDGAKMGLDYGKLLRTTRSVGVGGYCEDFLEEAIVTFRDSDGTLYAFEIEINISSPSPDIMAIPSLLGRDIINRWAITYDPELGILDAEVRSADLRVDPSSI